MTELTHDETNLLCIYQKGSRAGTIDNIKQMRKYLEEDETELLNMSDGLLQKFEAMSDADFDALELFPDF